MAPSFLFFLWVTIMYCGHQRVGGTLCLAAASTHSRLPDLSALCSWNALTGWLSMQTEKDSTRATVSHRHDEGMHTQLTHKPVHNHACTYLAYHITVLQLGNGKEDKSLIGSGSWLVRVLKFVVTLVCPETVWSNFSQLVAFLCLMLLWVGMRRLKKYYKRLGRFFEVNQKEAKEQNVIQCWFFLLFVCIILRPNRFLVNKFV